MSKKPLALSAVAALVLVGSASFALAQAPAPGLDAKVRDLIQSKLGDDAKAIKVALVKGKIVLTGEVAERSTQELCKEVALAVPGVTKVDNQVEAKKEKSVADGKIGDEMADDKLEGKVRSAVKGELGSHYKKVTIEVVAGVALIRGTVPDEERHQLALKAMGGVAGVKKTVDVLTVGK